MIITCEYPLSSQDPSLDELARQTPSAQLICLSGSFLPLALIIGSGAAFHALPTSRTVLYLAAASFAVAPLQLPQRIAEATHRGVKGYVGRVLKILGLFYFGDKGDGDLCRLCSERCISIV